MRFIGLAFVTLMTFISPASGTGFDQAVERCKAKEFQIAFAEFYELATDEHASAQVNLAIMFAKGQSVPQNDAHALYWAWRARFSGASQAIPIIDCLRRNSNLCRTTISMQQKVRAAERDLEMEHQRAPTPEELCEKMEMTLEELQNWQARFQASRVKSLDEVYTDHSLLFQDVTP